MTEKLAGIISATDDQWLEELIEEDAEVREKWENLSHIPVPPPPAPWLEVIDFPKQRSLQRVLAPWLCAAAVMALLVLAYRKWDQFKHAPATVIAKVNSDVLLQLPGQPAINLSTASGAIQIAGRPLPIKDNTLFLNTGEILPEGINTLVVPQGKNYQISLPDGSLITLNAATRMEFPFNFNGKTREITLNGEAYLKIAKQPGKPFLVHLPNSTVEVLGTSFNINSYDSKMVKVSLVDGKVRVKAGKKNVLIKPGQQAIYNNQTATLATQPFNATVELGWQKGLYCFSDTRLDEICNAIFRWYGVHATLDNPALANKTFTGLLDKQTPMSFFLEGIKAATGADHYFAADSTLHFK
ncbi:FecR family protein [Chitinophaga sp. 30R24]|uniref:FecR family protein n=1 Tax=Chitinophaga sp. 30R24 TaxID=3248838 RepID=UPI003B8FF843